MRKFLFVFLYVAGFLAARSEILLEESFSYPDGVLQDVSMAKWIGHSGDTNQVDVSDGAVNLTGKETQDVNAVLANGPFQPNSGTILYAGFKITFTALPTKTGSYFAHFKNSSATGFRGRIWSVLSADKKINLGVSSISASDPVLYPADLDLGTQYRVVIKLDVGTGETTLWLDPKDELDTSVQSEAGTGLSITSFALRQSSGMGTMQLDDLSVATTFEEAAGQISVPPAILQQPQSTNGPVGMDELFTVQAAGSAPLHYQWILNDIEIPGATNSTWAILAATPADAGTYKVRVSNESGSTLSEEATLTLQIPVIPPMILQDPVAGSIETGESILFTAEASGSEPLLYQWIFNGADIPDATNATWAISMATAADAGTYSVRISNDGGSVLSAEATLVVKTAAVMPIILEQPSPGSLDIGGSIFLTVVASGTEPLLYQWNKNGQSLPNQTNATLSLQNVTTNDSGAYSVSVMNEAGTVVSEPAVLQVNPPPLPKPAQTFFTNYLTHLVRPGDLETNTFSEHALQPGETLRMELSITNPEPTELSVLVNTNELPAQARWLTVDVSASITTALFEFTPSSESSGQHYVLRLQVLNGLITNEFDWSFYVPTEQEQNIVVTEYLANPESSPLSPYFNPLHRALPTLTPETDDQYIEIANLSDQAIDLNGWSFSDSVQIRHVFPESFSLPSSNALILYGGSVNGSIPVLNTPLIAASETGFGLGLTNTAGDSLILRNAAGRLISRVVFGKLESRSSMTRYPDGNGGFMPEDSLGANLFSPGTKWNGEPFADPPPSLPIGNLTVMEMQANKFHLTWQANPGQTYSILHAAAVDATFLEIGGPLQFPGTDGEFTDEANAEAGFYLVRSP